MNNRIKILTTSLLIIVCLFSVGCQKKITLSDEYNYDNISQYVELANYKEILKSTKDKDTAFQQIIDKSEIMAYPEKEYQERYDAIIDNYIKNDPSGDSDLEIVLNKATGLDYNTSIKYIKQDIWSEMKEDLVVRAMAEQEGIELTNEEYTAYIEKYMAQNGITYENATERLQMPLEDFIKQQRLENQYIFETIQNQL